MHGMLQCPFSWQEDCGVHVTILVTELHCWQEGVFCFCRDAPACKEGWLQVLETWAAEAGSQHLPLPKNLSILLLRFNTYSKHFIAPA